MDSVETKKYTITGLVDYTDEQGNIVGQLEVGSVQELPVSVGDAAVADGRAEEFTGEEEEVAGGDDTTTTADTTNTPAATKQYRVLGEEGETVSVDGIETPVDVGAIIELTDEQAEPLLVEDLIEELDEDDTTA